MLNSKSVGGVHGKLHYWRDLDHLDALAISSRWPCHRDVRDRAGAPKFPGRLETSALRHHATPRQVVRLLVLHERQHRRVRPPGNLLRRRQSSHRVRVVGLEPQQRSSGRERAHGSVHDLRVHCRQRRQLYVPNMRAFSSDRRGEERRSSTCAFATSCTGTASASLLGPAGSRCTGCCSSTL